MYRTNFWTFERLLKSAFIYITLGVLWWIIMFPYKLLTKPQYYILSDNEVQNFLLWFFIGIVPITVGLEILLFSCNLHKTPERIAKLILKAGYNLSPKEKEDLEMQCEEHNEFMGFLLFVLYIICTINAYYVYSLRLFVPHFAIIYGFFTIFLPVAFAIIPVQIYLERKYPSTKHLIKIATKEYLKERK